MKYEAVWTKKLVTFSVELYGKWVQFHAELPTDDFIVHTWRDL